MQQEITMSRRKSIEHCEVYTANSWVFSDPLGRVQYKGVAKVGDFPKHPKDGNAQRASISIAGLIHTVHEKESGQGPEREATAAMGYEAKHILGNTKTWKKSYGRSDTVYEECRASTLQLLPDRYVCFTIDPQLTVAQSQHISRERWREFPDYLSEASSPHGSRSVYSTLYSTIMRYAEVMHCNDIYIKIGGTRHRNYEVCYIVIVCANVRGRDPLPQLPTLTHSELIRLDGVIRPGSLLDMEGRVQLGAGKYTPKWASSIYEMPRFSPHSTATAVNGQPQYYDTLEFAFHFPSAVLYYPLLMSPTLVEHASCITAERDRKGCMETMVAPSKKRKLDLW